MNKIVENIKSLDCKLNAIQSKIVLTEQDINYINQKIEGLRNNLKLNSSNINNDLNQDVTSILRNTVNTVLSTPTNNRTSYKAKKKFLAETPNIMFGNLKNIPKSYLKKYLNTHQGGFSNNEKIYNYPGYIYSHSPNNMGTFNPPQNKSVIGCLSNVNNCGNNRITSFAEGNIGCSNMFSQGGQKFIFPDKIINQN